MSTPLVVTHHLRENPEMAEHFLFCGSTLSEIIEETEYIKKIRSTLAKVQPLLYKKECNHSIANGMLDSKLHFTESELVPDEETLSSNNKETLNRIKKVEEELLWVNKENERLKFKLEALRAAGAECVKHGSQKLQENYAKHSEDLKKRQEGVINTIKTRKLEQEQILKQSTDSLGQLSVQLNEKYGQIEELEKRVQRMEEEKKRLGEKKELLKKKLHQMMSNVESTRSCVKVQSEMCALQEQITHLDSMIHSQHQHLHNLIHQTEGLNNELKYQDERIENLKDQIAVLQEKNNELRYQVEFYKNQSKRKISKAVCTRIDENMPYIVISRRRK
ncbi:coiled-coil domain-containing protein 68 isoform X1 [Crotalus tigris]|uniref:coiled-coil domain-containing protein 68 isoform X1 n=2 Tax=Crotalus tigris TaxID=88082 RepID=UPI00192FAB0D|nr:coiled-coil domain-containing protein 68 isoform X1 [Crotalus tigris]XP_039177989.1 coiled-coil domain-containing protein 68 isoform X1 [Crotalus tigris]XP_039177990.1 coiled-coil domain-containing protein 68 isoform X1 [Crotalus tigris]XP_039177991.1 coiled-coil domain-containing protein 68 isoform X1 [Crotalus tigris]XP_039177992.1 coiled-coil domain-containing protein 68 isoform X1 [Crotalus tigris]XP_039177993.1 coiled-coil domain-containing protein 68 isoform X1 [Crotalus tigris]